MDNFVAILDFHADRTPERVAVVDGDLELTYRGLLDRVDALALVLRDLGVGAGDIVAILLANRAEFLETLFAANRIGAAFLPLNFRLAPDEWAYILGHSGAKVLVTETEVRAGIDGIAGSLPDLAHRLLVDGPAGAGEWQGYQELVAGSR